MFKVNWDKINNVAFEKQTRKQLNQFLETVPNTVLNVIKKKVLDSDSERNESKSSFNPLELLRISPISDITINELEFGSRYPEFFVDNFATADRELIDMFFEASKVKTLQIPDSVLDKINIPDDQLDKMNLKSQKKKKQKNQSAENLNSLQKKQVEGEIPNNKEKHVTKAGSILSQLNNSSILNQSRKGLNTSYVSNTNGNSTIESSQSPPLNDSLFSNSFLFGQNNISTDISPEQKNMSSSSTPSLSLSSSNYKGASMRSDIQNITAEKLLEAAPPSLHQFLSVLENYVDQNKSTLSTENLQNVQTIDKKLQQVYDLITIITSTVGDSVLSLELSLDSDMSIDIKTTAQAALPTFRTIGSFVSSFLFGRRRQPTHETKFQDASDSKGSARNNSKAFKKQYKTSKKKKNEKQNEKPNGSPKPFLSYPISATLTDIAFVARLNILLLTTSSSKQYVYDSLKKSHVEQNAEELLELKNLQSGLATNTIKTHFSRPSKQSVNKVETRDYNLKQGKRVNNVSSYGNDSYDEDYDDDDDDDDEHQGSFFGPFSMMTKRKGKTSNKKHSPIDNRDDSHVTTQNENRKDIDLKNGQTLQYLEDCIRNELPFLFFYICDNSNDPLEGSFRDIEMSRKLNTSQITQLSDQLSPMLSPLAQSVLSPLLSTTFSKQRNNNDSTVLPLQTSSPKEQYDIETSLTNSLYKPMEQNSKYRTSQQSQEDFPSFEQSNSPPSIGQQNIADAHKFHSNPSSPHYHPSARIYTFQTGILRRLGLNIRMGDGAVFSLGEVAPLEQFLLRKIRLEMNKSIYPTLYRVVLEPKMLLKFCGIHSNSLNILDMLDFSSMLSISSDSPIKDIETRLSPNTFSKKYSQSLTFGDDHKDDESTRKLASIMTNPGTTKTPEENVPSTTDDNVLDIAVKGEKSLTDVDIYSEIPNIYVTLGYLLQSTSELVTQFNSLTHTSIESMNYISNHSVNEFEKLLEETENIEQATRECTDTCRTFLLKCTQLERNTAKLETFSITLSYIEKVLPQLEKLVRKKVSM